MLPPLEYWTLDTVIDLSASAFDESLEVEKKASAKFDLTDGKMKRETLDELAKQVCAFANAGGGFLVYGVKDSSAGGGIDAGVPDCVGSGEPIASWVEHQIPGLVTPQITGCRARFVPLGPPPRNGALVVYIPSSELRPHWAKIGPREIPFLRTGGHSDVMALQTFRDIQSRGPTPLITVEDVCHWERHFSGIAGQFRPAVRLVAGPLCRHWAVEIRLGGKFGELDIPLGLNISRQSPQAVVFEPDILLYPRRLTHVPGANLTLRLRDGSAIARDQFLTVSVFAESAPPVERSISTVELFGS